MYWEKGLKLPHKSSAVVFHNLTFPSMNLGNEACFWCKGQYLLEVA